MCWALNLVNLTSSSPGDAGAARGWRCAASTWGRAKRPHHGHTRLTTPTKTETGRKTQYNFPQQRKTGRKLLFHVQTFSFFKKKKSLCKSLKKYYVRLISCSVNTIKVTKNQNSFIFLKKTCFNRKHRHNLLQLYMSCKVDIFLLLTIINSALFLLHKTKAFRKQPFWTYMTSVPLKHLTYKLLVGSSNILLYPVSYIQTGRRTSTSWQEPDLTFMTETQQKKERKTDMKRELLKRLTKRKGNSCYLMQNIMGGKRKIAQLHTIFHYKINLKHKFGTMLDAHV